MDRDLSRLLTHIAGLVTRIRGELPIRRDPAATRNVYGEQQLELDVWMNDLFVEAESWTASVCPIRRLHPFVVSVHDGPVRSIVCRKLDYVRVRNPGRKFKEVPDSGPTKTIKTLILIANYA